MTEREKTVLGRGTVTKSFDIQLDGAELTLRLVEAELELDASKRQAGVSPTDLLHAMHKTSSSEVRGLIDSCVKFSEVAMHFFAETLVEASAAQSDLAHMGLYKDEGGTKQ